MELISLERVGYWGSVAAVGTVRRARRTRPDDYSNILNEALDLLKPMFVFWCGAKCCNWSRQTPVTLVCMT